MVLHSEWNKEITLDRLLPSIAQPVERSRSRLIFHRFIVIASVTLCLNSVCSNGLFWRNDGCQDERDMVLRFLKSEIALPRVLVNIFAQYGFQITSTDLFCYRNEFKYD